LLALTDVNGDSLPDKVFRTPAGVFYRPNLSGPTGAPRFGDTPIKLTNLPGISSESTRSVTAGVESYFGIAAQLDHVSTTTRSDRYFADVNGDGLTDLVTNGSVLFGHLDANGNPAYSANSNDTPVPIGTGGASGSIVGDQTAEFERQVDAFPLLDSVRRWVPRWTRSAPPSTRSGPRSTTWPRPCTSRRSSPSTPAWCHCVNERLVTWIPCGSYG
ncbi:hypothetical protein ACFQ1S_39005, partial [Kibdelosporangium lantanae]